MGFDDCLCNRSIRAAGAAALVYGPKTTTMSYKCIRLKPNRLLLLRPREREIWRRDIAPRGAVCVCQVLDARIGSRNNQMRLDIKKGLNRRMKRGERLLKERGTL
jgi:hypothetical protein